VTYKLRSAGTDVFITFEWKNPILESRSATYKVFPDSFRKHFDIALTEKNDVHYHLAWNIHTNLKAEDSLQDSSSTLSLSASSSSLTDSDMALAQEQGTFLSLD